MMRPSLSQGGVLSVGEQSQLHEKLRGVGYKSEAQRAQSLARVVRPFKSLLVDGAPAANIDTSSVVHPPPPPPAQDGSRRAASHKSSSSRPSSASHSRAPSVTRAPSSRPASAASHKKSSSLSAAPSAPRPANVASPGDLVPSFPVPEPPAWIANAVHKPDRPNAPSQQTPAERRAAHRPPAVQAAIAAGKPVPPARAAKSHKLVSKPYASPYTNASPRSLDEANAQVSIQRHARPLIVRPADKASGAKAVVRFVPIGHVVGVMPLQAAKQRRQEAMQSPHQTFAEKQEEIFRAEQMQLQQQHEQKYSSAHPQPLPPSALATPCFDSLPPNPFASKFDEGRHSNTNGATAAAAQGSRRGSTAENQPPAANHNAATNAAEQQHPTSPPSLSVRTVSETQHEPIETFHPSQEALSSPSPVRSSHPPAAHAPAQQEQQLSPSASSSTIASPSGGARSRRPADFHSPAQLRRRQEAEHEKQMKNYLSPSSRTKGRAAVPGQGKDKGTLTSPGLKHSAAAQFTPNPHAKGGNDANDSTQDGSSPHLSLANAPHNPSQTSSHTSSQSSLFYEPLQTRPADLPPLPVEHAPPKLLYPPRESSPGRALAAALRGPGLRYEKPSGGDGSGAMQGFDHEDNPLSPRVSLFHDDLHDTRAEAVAAEVASELSAVVSQRKAQRAEIAKAEKARWDSRLQLLRQANLAQKISEREMRSPFTSPKAADAPTQMWPREEKKNVEAGEGTTLRFDDASHQQVASTTALQQPAIASSSHSPSSAVVPNLRSTSTSDATARSEPRVIGERTAEPRLESHGRMPQHLQQQQLHSGRSRSNSNITFATAPAPSSSTAPTAAAPSPSSHSHRRFVVGSTNSAKLNAVREVVESLFGSSSSAPAAGGIHADSPAGRGQPAFGTAGWRPAEVVGVSVESIVRAQPLSGTETLTGAIGRAKLALASDPLAEFGVGVEGGLEQLDQAPHAGEQDPKNSHDASGRWFQAGWIAVVDRQGRVGTGSSARVQVAESGNTQIQASRCASLRHIASELQSGETEMATIVDRLSGLINVRSKQGFMGLVTNGQLERAACYRHGVLFALAPFISAPVYWRGADATPTQQTSA